MPNRPLDKIGRGKMNRTSDQGFQNPNVTTTPYPVLRVGRDAGFEPYLAVPQTAVLTGYTTSATCSYIVVEVDGGSCPLRL
jgi:hypothetical protein